MLVPQAARVFLPPPAGSAKNIEALARLAKNRLAESKRAHKGVQLTSPTFFHMLLVAAPNSASPKLAVLFIPSVVLRGVVLERRDELLHVLLPLHVNSFASSFFTLQ